MKVGFVLMALLVGACVVAVGCVPGGGHYQKESPAGFFSGVWHGWIAPVTLIVGIFDDTIRIYEVNNTGWWYDVGFYIAVIGGFGGIAFTRRHLKKKGGA